MKDGFFKSSDFVSAECGGIMQFLKGEEKLVSLEAAAERANLILTQRGTRVYAQKHANGMWTSNEQPYENDTHQALLVNITPIEKSDTTKEAKDLLQQCADMLARARRMIQK